MPPLMLVENVYDDIAEVEQHPLCRGTAFHTDGFGVVLPLEGLDNVLCDGCELSGVCAVAKYKPIAERGSSPYINDCQFSGFHLYGCLGSRPNNVLGIDGGVLYVKKGS